MKNLADSIQAATFDMLNYERNFTENNKDCLDFGECGMAIVLINFGRKVKLKKEAQENGLITDHTWEISGKKYYVVSMPSSTVPTQYAGFYMQRANMFSLEIKAYYENTDVDVYVHSWVD